MMEIRKSLLLMAVLAAPLAWAQMPAEHGSMTVQQMPAHQVPTAAAMSSGEIRRIDQNAGKITLKHGEIKHLDMPGMTMVFTVKDKALLTPFKAGDKVQFMVIDDHGQMVITDMEPAK